MEEGSSLLASKSRDTEVEEGCIEIEGYGGEGANVTKYISLVESDGLVHGRLDMQRLDVLPIFLQERNEEINTLKDDSQCSSIDPALYSTHST